MSTVHFQNLAERRSIFKITFKEFREANILLFHILFSYINFIQKVLNFKLCFLF